MKVIREQLADDVSELQNVDQQLSADLGTYAYDVAALNLSSAKTALEARIVELHLKIDSRTNERLEMEAEVK